mgnify:CR=1 FL=1
MNYTDINILNDLRDLNRYTFILDETKYVDEFNEIMTGFADEGYDVVKVKNYWDGDGYRGLNVNLRDLDGRKIEFQFKDNFSHTWYEESRLITTTAERKLEIEALSNAKWKTVNQPLNFDQIDWFP